MPGSLDASTAPPTVARMSAETRYDAFISYSHAVDGRLAPALQTGLHRFAKPWYRLRALRVFRDEASLSANPALWTSIVNALDRSRAFLLLASPEAAASQWVAREVAWWSEHKSVEQLFIVLTSGEIAWSDEAGDFDRDLTDALPPGLAGAFPEEPRWTDLRWARSSEDVSLRNPRFRGVVAELAAPLHGRAKDELVGEDVRQHRRAMRLARSAAATLVALLLVAVALAIAALDQRNSAREERDRAEEQLQIATSRLLAGRSNARLQVNPREALALALQAFRAHPTAEARRALRAGVTEAPLYEIRVANDGGGLATGAEFSPDGELLVTTGGHGARVWEAATGRRIAILEDPRTPAKDATFSPDGRLLVTDGEQAFLVWSPRSGERLAVLRKRDPDHTYETTELFNHSGTLLAADDSGGTRVWDTRTWKVRKSLPGKTPLAFSPDGGELAVAREQRRGVVIRDTRTWQRVTWPDQPDRGSFEVLFSADGGRVVTLSSRPDPELARVTVRARSGLIVHPPFDVPRLLDGGARALSGRMLSRNGALLALTYRPGESVPIWRLRDGRRVLTLRAMALRPDWERALWQRADGSLALTETATGLSVRTLRFPQAPFELSVHLSPNALVATAGEGVVRVWKDPLSGPWGTHGFLTGRSSTRAPDRQIAFAPDRAAVAVGRTVWRPQGPTRLETTFQDVVAFSPDGRLVAVGDVLDAGDRYEKTIHVLDSGSGKRVATVHDANAGVWSPGGELFAAWPVVEGGPEPGVRLFDARSWQRVRTTGIRPQRIIEASFSSDARLVVSGLASSRESDLDHPEKSVVWRALDGHVVRTVDGHPSQFAGPDIIVSAAQNQNAVIVRHARSGKRLAKLDAVGVYDISLSRDAKLVALTGTTSELSAEPRTMVADTGSWKPLTTVRGAFIDFDPSGRLIATVTNDEVGHIWDTRSGEAVLDIAQSQALRTPVFGADGESIVGVGLDNRVRTFACEACRPISELLRDAEARVSERR